MKEMKICIQCREVITGKNINPNYRGMTIHYGQDWFCGPVVDVADDVWKGTIEYLEAESKRVYELEELLANTLNNLMY